MAVIMFKRKNWIQLFSIFVFCLFLRGSVGQCQCPNNWITFQGTCYYFGHGHRMHFSKAEKYCKNHGAQLVQIDSVIESAFLKDYISRLTGQRFWIGLVDRDTEGVWKWLNGTSPTYKDWAPNEPNAYQQSDDCACLAKDYNNHWIDEDCEKTYYLAICEKRGAN